MIRFSPSNHLLAIWQYLKASLWFIPVLMCLGAAVLARVAVELQADARPGQLNFWLSGANAADAAELLGKLMSSLMGMLALVASLTMVVLTLAATQLGPRLIRIFMGDVRTQLVFGAFAATVVYLLLVLHSLGSDLPFADVPHVAVTLGVALGLVCLVALLLFVHHLARSVVADTVIAHVGNALDQQIAETLPERRGDQDLPPPQDGDAATVTLGRCGYVEAVDYPALVEAAANAGAVLCLRMRPGSHVLADMPQAEVRPGSACTDDLREAICGAVLIANHRTPTQDIEFVIGQLVEIALRALSPSLNDPFTAIAVLDRLAVSLSNAMRRGAETGAYRDPAGKVRVEAMRIGIAEFAAAAFDQIRQNAKPIVLGRMLDVLLELSEEVRTESQRQVLYEHGRLVLEQARRTIQERADLAPLERRHAELQRVLAAPLGRAATPHVPPG